MEEKEVVQEATEVNIEAPATEDDEVVISPRGCDGQCSSCDKHTEETEAAEQQFSVSKSTVEKLNALMAKADKGAKLSRKDMLFAIRVLRGVCQIHEQMLHGILNDLVTLAKELGTTDHGVFDLSTTFAAVHMLLKRKGLITDEEVVECWKEVMAQAKKELQEAKEEQEAELEKEQNRIIVPGK